MSRYLLLTLLFTLSLCTRGRAQGEFHPEGNFAFPEVPDRIIPVSAKTAARFLTDKNFVIPKNLPTRLDTTARAALPPGHYLHAAIDGEMIEYNYFHTYRHQAEATFNDRKFELRVYDADGKARTDARVLADGKAVRYRKKHGAYRRRDWRIDLLSVAVDRDTLYLRVDEQNHRSRGHMALRTIRYSLPGRLVTAPYRLAKRSYWYVKRGISRGDWYWYWNSYPLQRYIEPLINPAEAVGYVTTNKPKYRPGDSLHVSAYLTKPNGKPLRVDSLAIKIEPDYGKAVLEATAFATAEGRYEFRTVVPENWPLDKRYRIQFEPFGWSHRNIGPSINFRVEDYQLDEYKLSATASEDARLPGTAWLDVTATDVNGQALPDGLISVRLRPERFLQTTTGAPSLRLSDTLAVLREPTGNRVERRIYLPDSLFPAGYALNCRAFVELSSPSGERQTQELLLTIDRRYPVLPDLQLVADSLQLRLLPEGRTGAATLRGITPRGDTTVTALTLPTKLAVDHRMERYELSYGEQLAELEQGELAPTDGPGYYFAADTFVVQLPNPYGQEVYWELRGEEKTYSSTRHGERARLPGFRPTDRYTFVYRYLAGGAWKSESAPVTVPHYDWLTENQQVLALDLRQAEQVRPGETVRVEVRATDYRGRPARNVRLSAGTVNARFADTPVKMPTYEKRTKRQRRKLQEYTLQEAEKTRNHTPPWWLLRQIQLDTALAYQLRYPAPAFTYARRIDALLPLGQVHSAHYSPFIVSNGSVISIRAVYADNRLVYWWHPNDMTPYAIPLSAGAHDITLRTDLEIYRKRIHFQPGEQLITSFDWDWTNQTTDGWVRTPQHKWTQAEIKNLQQHVFSVTGMSSDTEFTFRTGSRSPLHTARTKGTYAISPLGLANFNDNVTFWLRDTQLVNFFFEPEATYRITQGRDRLYPLTTDDIRNFLRTGSDRTVSEPGLPRYRYVPPVRTQFIPVIDNRQELPYVAPSEVQMRLQITNLPDEITHVLLSPLREQTYFKLERNRVHNIRRGRYEIIYRSAGDSIYRQAIEFGRDSLHLLRFDWSAVTLVDRFDAAVGYQVPEPEPKPSEEPPVRYADLFFSGDTIIGTIVSDDGEPLIGCSILIEGTTVGTISDLNGKFELELPDGCTRLRVNYTGFETQTVHLQKRSGSWPDLVVTLNSSSELLDEVIVVGYGTERKRDITGTVKVEETLRARAAGVVITEGVPGTAPKVTIRGVGTLNADKIYVDGVLQEANFMPSSIQADIVDIRREDGATYITTNNPPDLLDGSLPAPTVRSAFFDEAAFVPHLSTDENGYAAFNVTFPDDITAWNTYAVGQDRKRRVGFATARTKSYLPIQAQLYLPRFLVEGDRSEALTLAINRTAAAVPVRLSFSGSGAAAGAVDTTLAQSVRGNYPILAGKVSTLARPRSSADASPTPVADSLSYRFSLQSRKDPNVSDGEERQVPVYPRGTETVSGDIFFVGAEATPLPTDFALPERGPATLRIFGNRLEQLLGDLDYIVRYPYACTEQTASRLIGLLAQREIQRRRGQSFSAERQITRMIKRLQKVQKADGGYGWWPDSPESSDWISLHAYRALARAAAADFAVGDLEALRRYLLDAAPALPPLNRVNTYLALAENGTPPTDAEIHSLDTLVNEGLYVDLVRTRLHQLRSDTVDLEALVARSGTRNAYARYWGNSGRRFWRRPVDNRLACTLLAYRILHAAEHPAADEAVNYLLGQSPRATRPGSVPLLGTNSLESALLVDELLEGLLGPGETLTVPAVQIRRGNVTERVNDYPYEMNISPAELGSVTLTKEGSGPVPATVYQRYFERSPVATDEGFTVTSRLVDARGRPLAAMTKGETAYLEVSVDARTEGDYVLVEIPIPGGCSYADRREARGPYAVHRAYERDRVAIFCNRLPRGRHTYRVALDPRFSGTYTVNPARAELQYLPTVRGANGIEALRVE